MPPSRYRSSLGFMMNSIERLLLMTAMLFLHLVKLFYVQYNNSSLYCKLLFVKLCSDCCVGLGVRLISTAVATALKFIENLRKFTVRPR